MNDKTIEIVVTTRERLLSWAGLGHFSKTTGNAVYHNRFGGSLLSLISMDETDREGKVKTSKQRTLTLRGSITDLLFILYGFSCFAHVKLVSALLVWLNLNQSNRRSVVPWYFPLWWVVSVQRNWNRLKGDGPVRPDVGIKGCPKKCSQELLKIAQSGHTGDASVTELQQYLKHT